jgi:hypothetical protein
MSESTERPVDKAIKYGACAAGCGGGETTAGGRIGASVCLLLARLGPFFFGIGLHAGLISAGSVGAAG